MKAPTPLSSRGRNLRRVSARASDYPASRTSLRLVLYSPAEGKTDRTVSAEDLAGKRLRSRDGGCRRFRCRRRKDSTAETPRHDSSGLLVTVNDT